MTDQPSTQSDRERMVTAFDIPMCANDIGMGRCDECLRRVDRARMKQRRRIRRRARRARTPSASRKAGDFR